MHQLRRFTVLFFCIAALAQQEKVTLPSGTAAPFDVTKHSVPLDEIAGGGPPKDGIPSLIHPKFVSTQAAHRFLAAHDRVFGLVVGQTAKAYPIKILNWHEIVNDEIEGIPVAVTWCPLCVSGVVFDARVSGNSLTFGVTGKLYKSNLVMYDRQTGSLWSQSLQEAIAGQLTGTKLRMIPAQITTWKEWSLQHPSTDVLSPDTGFHRNYGLNPYAPYYGRGIPIFEKQGVKPDKSGLHPMERVLGVQVDGIERAYPFRYLKKHAPEFQDKLGNVSIIIRFDAKSETAFALDGSGRPIPSIVMFWFAWRDSYPNTTVSNLKRR